MIIEDEKIKLVNIDKVYKEDYIPKNNSEIELLKYKVDRLEKENDRLRDSMDYKNKEINENVISQTKIEINRIEVELKEKFESLDKKIAKKNYWLYAVIAAIASIITWVSTNLEMIYNFLNKIFE